MLGLKKPHVGNLSNYAWIQERCITEVASCSSYNIFNQNDMAKRFNLRNKKGSFFEVLYEPG